MAALQAPSAADTSPQSFPPPLRMRGGGLNRLGSRRARAACALCRWRKVRCDAKDGQPCSTCSFEDVECVMTQKERRRKTCSAPKPYIPPANTEGRETDAPLEVLDRASPQGQITQRKQSVPANSNAQPACHTLQRSSQPEANRVKTTPDWHDLNAFAAQSLPEPAMSPMPSLDFSAYGRTLSSIERSLKAPVTPSYLKPLPPHLAQDDAEYLQRKGALAVPDPDLRDGLLRSYIEFVHPCLPILDLRAFQASLENPTQHGQLSYPLFQAVMFAGAAWVDIKPLRKLGFLTRKAARKALYQKARLLYDSDYEQDRLCLVQTLLLLTLWWEGPNEQKDGWHWSGLSLSVARTIGLTRDSASQNLDPGMQRLRRRLWWSVLMRDTIASFGLNRAPRITDSCYDVAMLTMDDFDIEEPQSQATYLAAMKSFQQQRQMAIICIEMAKLCRLISRILEAAYAENPVGQIGTLYSNQELNPGDVDTPARKQVDSRKLSICEEALREWRAAVPEQALHASPTPNVQDVQDQPPLLHRALLSMLYFTALLSLHRPRVLTSSIISIPHENPAQQLQDASRAMVRYAAAQVNIIAMDLYQADLVRLIPATAISCLIPVSLSHVDDLKSADELTRREGAQRLEECKQVLRELADAHIAAEWAINFLGFVASQARHKEAAHRKLTGMMSGNIQWNLQTHTRQTEQAVSASPVSQRTHQVTSHMDTETTGAQSEAQNFNGVSQQINFDHFSPTNVGKTRSNSAHSPDDFSNMINFPEMWLDFAGTSESMLGLSWIDNNQVPMNIDP